LFFVSLSGRLVAGYFEELPPRKGNEDYYAKTPMPISLTTLEQKLYRRDFADLVEFEAWLRRMVKNAKDYYPRTSQVFEDAERVRKAVSNYMTKTNPAYRSVANYSSQPIPVPDNYVPIEWEDGSDAAGGDVNKATASNSPGEDDAEGEVDEDAEGEEEEQEAEDEEEDEEEESDAGAGRRKIVIKTRTPGRPVSRGTKAKPDHEYEDAPYKGLNFQQAQEKIVEEMIRAPDDEWVPSLRSYVSTSAVHANNAFSGIPLSPSLRCS
jgi:cobalamin biosynthesis protein CobT